MGTRRMLKCLFWLGLITSLGILQVHIQFKIRDLQMQTIKLQEEKSFLLDSRNKLQSKVETLRRGERIVEIAEKELGLVQYPANRLERLRISDSVAEKYKSVATIDRSITARPGGSTSTEETVLTKLGSLLGVHQVSQAREY